MYFLYLNSNKIAKLRIRIKSLRSYPFALETYSSPSLTKLEKRVTKFPNDEEAVA